MPGVRGAGPRHAVPQTYSGPWFGADPSCLLPLLLCLQDEGKDLTEVTQPSIQSQAWDLAARPKAPLLSHPLAHRCSSRPTWEGGQAWGNREEAFRSWGLTAQVPWVSRSPLCPAAVG